MERKEPTLGGAAPESYEPESGARRARPAAGNTRPAKSSASKPSPVQKAAPSRLGGLALLVAVAALGGSGFLAWQLQQSQEALATADSRLVALEQKFELSDDESSQSVTALQAKLKWADAEIRKLWGVSYDTNRKNISAHKAKLASLEKSLGAVSKTAKATKTTAATAQNQLSKLQVEFNELSQQNVAGTAKFDSALAGLDSQRKLLQQSTDDVNRLKQQLAKLNLDLNSRVKDNEEAIDAIDKHRLTVNRELSQIKQRLGGTVQ